MPTLIPHLWYDKEALQAAQWYVSLFKNASILGVTTIYDTPSGDAELVDFKLANLRLSAISAGPYFSFNPSISLMVSCRDEEEVDRLYASLRADDLMPLDAYPFSKRYAWVRDRYGLNWQLMFTQGQQERHHIRLSLLFSGEACGKAQEAMDYYASVFAGSTVGFVNRYQAGEAEDPRAKVNYAELNIADQQLVMMDHGYGADFTFNEAFSLMVICGDQEEIDYYWERLSHVPEAEQCGWAKDRFGLSWQITPDAINETLMKGTEEETRRVTQAFLKMKKIDLAALEKARIG